MRTCWPRTRGGRLVGCLLAVLMLSAYLMLPKSPARAATFEETIIDSFGAAGDQFGYAVDIDGDGMVIGAPYTGHAGAESRGSITYVRRTVGGWNERHRLNFVSDDPIIGAADWMVGDDVAIAGETTVVGAPIFPLVQGGVSYLQGTAVVIHWSDGAVASSDWLHGFYRSEFFGDSVAIDGQVAVGAPFASIACDEIAGCPPGDDIADLVGRAEVDGEWLVAADPQDDLGLGWDIAIAGNRLAASANGAVYVFEQTSGWHQVQRIDVGHGGVAMDNDLLVIGDALATNRDGHDTGVVWIYRWNGVSYALEDTVWPGGTEAVEAFGASVDVDGDRLIVGAPNRDRHRGAAYLYQRSGGRWLLADTLLAPARESMDLFGHAVAISDHTVAVGAPGDTNENGVNAGAVHVFDATASPPSTTTTTQSPSTTVTGSQGRFIDDDDSIFEADIEWLAEQGITAGCNPPSNTRFCPGDDVTRGQMAAFLVRAFGYSDDGGGDLFTDDDGSVFERDIDRLGTAGVTRGCDPPSNTRFCPDDSVTRGQMAAFLVRAFGYSDDGGGDLFTDDDGSVFERDIDRLGTAGVTRGCNPPTNTMFCPDTFVTRGEMAAFLHRAME